VRDTQPVNLVSAFESPVRGNDGIAGKSALRLAEEMNRARAQWGLTPVLVAAQYPGDNPVLTEAFGPSVPFPQVLATVLDSVRDRLPEKVATQ